MPQVDLEWLNALAAIMGRHQIDQLQVGADGAIVLVKSRHSVDATRTPEDTRSAEQRAADDEEELLFGSSN